MTDATLLHHLLDNAARRWPQSPAVSTRASTLSYGELDAFSRRLADWLRTAGLIKGDRVVVSLPPSPLIPALVYACSRLGLVFSVLHEQVREGPLVHVLDDCEPRILVCDDPEALTLASARGILGVHPDELHEAGSGPAPSWSAPEPIPTDPMCLIYTSGTTSLPKAVVSTHQQGVFAASAIHSVLGYRSDDIIYCALPLSFDYGLYQVFLAALSGAHVRLGRPAETGPALLRNLNDIQATILPAVPAVADGLAWLVRRAKTKPPLRLITNTGAAMSAATIATLREAIPGLGVHLMFGLTECKRAAIMPRDGDLERPGSCGAPLPGTEVFVIDGEGNRLPPGEIGEFVVRGPNVMAGYWRRPELTEKIFPRRDGLFPELRTGDHGWVDADGYLYFDGRRDDIYKERGFRVSATEVAAAACRVPGVESAAVLTPKDGNPATLVVVGTVDSGDVLELMRGHIEEFKVPRRCVVMESLPLNANGKVDHRELSLLVGQR